MWLDIPPDVDLHTWQRMIRWGMIPKDFDNLLMFAGMEHEARRLMCSRIGHSLRDAAVNCLWHAQSLTTVTPSTRQMPVAEKNRTVLPRDRGIWKGTTAGGIQLTAQQLARHEASLASARTKAANDAAALAELNRTPAAVPTTPTSGCFLRVKLASTAGGVFVAASNPSASLQQFRKDANTPRSRAWATLPRWWSWSNERTVREGTRFQGILRPIDGVCGTRTDGVRCSREGYRGHDGRIRCAPCRADRQSKDSVSCDICGCAAKEGIWDWSSIGRMDMVCGLCTNARAARAPNLWCDCCGTERATQATADGSASCSGCGDGFSQAEGWLARAQRLCKRAARRLGAPASRFTEESARNMWLTAADQWAKDSGTDFCGNAISWSNICSTVLEWMHTNGICADTPSLHTDHDGTDPAWMSLQTAHATASASQRTLLDFGFQGRAISITRPVFPRLSVTTDPTRHSAPPPRFHPLVAARNTLRARTQQRMRPSVRSNVSATAEENRPRPIANSTATFGPASGGQGGGTSAQHRQPARTAGGRRVKGSRSNRRLINGTTRKESWSTEKTTPAQRPDLSPLKDCAWKLWEDRHVTRPPE